MRCWWRLDSQFKFLDFCDMTWLLFTVQRIPKMNVCFFNGRRTHVKVMLTNVYTKVQEHFQAKSASSMTAKPPSEGRKDFTTFKARTDNHLWSAYL
jgi:hypothetical protein